MLKVTTNYTYSSAVFYSYVFANVFTNHLYTNTAYILKTYSGPPIGSPYGTPPVTQTSSPIATNQVVGDFFVLPPFFTNFCPLGIYYTNLPNLVVATNLISAVNTNIATGTISSSVYLVTYSTNYSYWIHPVTCTETANAVGLYQGIENVKFVRADYDSTLGQYFKPITNIYTMVMMTNSQAFRQNFQRIVTAPDFLMMARDMATTYAERNLNFNQANIYTGLAGPGTIYPPTTFTFNKVGAIYLNGSLAALGLATNAFLSEFARQTKELAWGSFDGSTNAPIVYPNGTSIQDLENRLLVQLAPAGPLTGTFDFYMEVNFTATGGAFSPPFTWSATGLPSWLTLSPAGKLFGIPAQTGTFNFTLQLTDSLSRSVQWPYSITIQ